MRRNHELFIEARRLICRRLGVAAVGGETMVETMVGAMVGAMSAFHLPDDTGRAKSLDDRTTPGPSHPLWKALGERYGIEVPVYNFPATPKRLLRISAQAYNRLTHDYLADALAALL